MLVTQVVNKVLTRGKRTLAERIVYGALDLVQERAGSDPVAVLKRAVENTRPELEVQEPPGRWGHLPGARSRCGPAGPPPWPSAG